MGLSLPRHLWTRLQGCTPAWMQVVEPRLEQAAEESSKGRAENDNEETRRIPATLISTFCGMNFEEKV